MATDNMLLADGVHRDPYASPDVPVSLLNPSGSLRTNALRVEEASSRPSNNLIRLSRLGIANTYERTVCLTILLRTEVNNRPTLARRERVVITLSHRDGDNDWYRAGIFTTVMQEHGSLDLRRLMDLALMVPDGLGHIDVRDAVREFRAEIPSRTVAGAVFRAQMSLVIAIDLLNKALDPGDIKHTPAMGLHAAWRQHVTTHRRPQIQYEVEDQLLSADSAIEDVAKALLARGVTWDSMRYRLHTVYTSIFQLRLITRAYAKGVWE